MIGRITLKRALKRTAGLAAVADASIRRRGAAPHACILVYHRIADVSFVDPACDDWNVDPRTFERQVAALAECATIVPLSDVLRLLAERRNETRPLACLTFDDGYANFASAALPVLVRYGAPATVFVVTDAMDREGPMPFDAWSRAHAADQPPEAWRPLRWEELDRCVATGLVAVGAHSHTHRNGLGATREELDEEASRARSLLVARYGAAAGEAYSYPYGSRRLGQVTDAYVGAVRRAGFRTGVTTDLGVALPGDDPLALPRVEAHGLDTGAVITAKARGALGPYRLTDRLRRARRAGASTEGGH
ncbi:MAG TPA: polysaccharide deacetylase family protein [Bacteroidota bacterium]|nr:polysaccharide deacetylase family protein [Bacteroidota bacterium]